MGLHIKKDGIKKMDDKTMDMKSTKALAVQIRKNILRAIASAGKGHIGGSLSIADTLAVLYNGVMNIDPNNPSKKDRDILVMSKGHCGPAFYGALAAKGYFADSWLDTLNKNNTRLPSHTDRLKTPGVDMTTGSLGQGASTAAGSAFADALDHKDNYTYLILGDGELDEGQVWESFLFVSHRKLTNLITIVDANGKQLDGTTESVCNLGSIEDKFRSFGYHVISVKNGNDCEQIYEALKEAKQTKDRPSTIILHTIKGAGIQYYATMDNCHSTEVKKEMLDSFYKELDDSLNEVNNV